ncbi:actinodin4 precursor-like [Arapaima gigas]
MWRKWAPRGKLVLRCPPRDVRVRVAADCVALGTSRDAAACSSEEVTAQREQKALQVALDHMLEEHPELVESMCENPKCYISLSSEVVQELLPNAGGRRSVWTCELQRGTCIILRISGPSIYSHDEVS